MLRIGVGRVEITPAPGLRMAGNAPYPRAEGRGDPLYGRVLLADDGARRVAIVCLDLMALPAAAVATLRARLAGIGGLDAGAILVACSHTHRAPFTYAAGAADADEAFGYLETIYQRATRAMAEAVARLQPAELIAGTIAAPGWVFNRRPIYADGEVGTHGPAGGPDFVRMEDAADDEVQILLARGGSGATIGGLIGFACHPTVMEESTPAYSADFAGALVGALEERHGGIFGFLLGASGDTAPNDPFSPFPRHGQGEAHHVMMGRALADQADAANRAARAVESTHIGVATTRLQIAQRQPTPQQIALARWYLEERPADLDEAGFTWQLTGHRFTFGGAATPNERFARELLGMWEWQRRAGAREPVEEVEVQVLTLGGIALVGLPVELFATYGRRIKAASPYGDTFVATLANGWHGYAPTPEAFARGGYEPRLTYASRLAPEAGDLLTTAALDLLQRLAPR
jgi:hypothetical protein